MLMVSNNLVAMVSWGIDGTAGAEDTVNLLTGFCFFLMVKNVLKRKTNNKKD